MRAKLFKIALEGSISSMVTVRAIEVLYERGYGKAPVTLEDADGNSIAAGIVLLPMEKAE